MLILTGTLKGKKKINNHVKACNVPFAKCF